MHFKVNYREFPGGLVVRIPGFLCHGPGLIPGWGTEILQATQHSPPPPKNKVNCRHQYISPQYFSMYIINQSISFFLCKIYIWWVLKNPYICVIQTPHNCIFYKMKGHRRYWSTIHKVWASIVLWTSIQICMYLYTGSQCKIYHSVKYFTVKQ